MFDLNKNNWPEYQFSEIAEQISERVDPAETDAEVYVGLEHIEPNSIHIKEHGKPSDVKGTKLKVYKGDIIFGKRRAYQRKAAIANFDGICSAHAMVLRAKAKVMIPELFPFFLHSDAFMNRAIDISEGSLSPTIKWKILAKQKFVIPPLDEQKKLADLLWAGDSLIESYIYSYEELFIFFKTKLFNHFSNKNLDQIEIGKLGKVITGKTPSTSNQKAWNGDVPFVTPSDLTEGQKYFEKTERTVNNSYVQNYLLPENSILVTCIASIGQISISNKVVCTNQQINSIIPTLIEDAEFIYYSILAKMHSFKRIAGTSVVPIINKSTFEKFKINYSSNKNIKIKVVEDLRMLEKVINLTKRTIQKSRKLNKKIIDDIFS